MSRLVLAVVMCIAAAPVAAADATETVYDAEAQVFGAFWYVYGSVVDTVVAWTTWEDTEETSSDRDAAPDEPAPEEAPEDDRASEDPTPTYANDPLLGSAGPGGPLVLELRDTVAPVPVAGSAVGGLLADLGFRDADAAAPSDTPRAAPLAPAAATVAPATPVPEEATLAAAAVAAVAVAGAAGAATGFAPAWAEKVRRVFAAATGAHGAPLRRIGTFLGVALYTRLARTELLDHEVRDRIYAAVRDRPGVTLAELAALGGVGRTAASYHLRVLAREGMVASRRDGRVRRFHANGTALDSPARLAALGHPSGQALAAAVRAEPGQDQSSLATRLGMSPSLAHWHLKRLEEANVVQKVRDGRKVRYFPASA